MVPKKLKEQNEEKREFNLRTEEKTIKISNPERNKVIDFSGEHVMIFIGKSKRGKSTAVKEIVYRETIAKPVEERFQKIFVFTSTKFNNFYQQFLPDKYIFNGYEEEDLEAIFERYKDFKKKHKDRNPPRTLIIFEDVTGVLNTNNSFFGHFITTARHLGITVIICVQYLLKNINPTVRNQTTFAFMFNDKTYKTIDAFHKSFGASFKTHDDFQDFFLKETGGKDHHNALLYDEYNDEEPYSRFRAINPENLPKVKLVY